MKLLYIYHSGFLLEGEDFILVIDYYRDSGEVIQGVVHDLLKNSRKRWYVLVSHRHPDHFNSEILQWSQQVADIHYLFSRDVCKKLRQEERDGIVFLSKQEVWEDDIMRIKAYGSTDIGVSFCISFRGKFVFHAGDLNNWHWQEESTPQESATYERNFLRELQEIAAEVAKVDLAFFPVDPRLGKDYMRGAMQFIDHIAVKCLVPMHFWENYAAANVLGDFVREKGIRFITLNHPGQSIELA